MPALAAANGKAHPKIRPAEYRRGLADVFRRCKTYMDQPFFSAQNEAELFVDVLRTEVRVLDRKSFLAHKKYIDENPVKAGLAKSAEEYPYCSAYFRKKKKASG